MFLFRLRNIIKILLFVMDVVKMDKWHILLGRPWQHGVDATHKRRENIYMFAWKGKRVVMKPTPPVPNLTTVNESKLISICNWGKFLMKSKEPKQNFALVVKEEITPFAEISKEITPLLEGFKPPWHQRCIYSSRFRWSFHAEGEC